MQTRRGSDVMAIFGVLCASFMVLSAWFIGRPDRVVSADQNVRIDSPADGESVSGRIDIRVTATMDDPSQIDFFRIYVGNGRSPAAMRPLGPPRTAPVEHEVLATLDTSLLQAGEATIELRLFPKNGDSIFTRVVVNVQVGPTPTRTFSGPVITIPPVAIAPQQVVPGSGAPAVPYPVEAMPDVEIPQFAPIQPTPIPIARLTPEYIYDTLPGDPVQTDPLFTDLPATPIPLPTQKPVPIPR